MFEHKLHKTNESSSAYFIKFQMRAIWIFHVEFNKFQETRTPFVEVSLPARCRLVIFNAKASITGMKRQAAGGGNEEEKWHVTHIYETLFLMSSERSKQDVALHDSIFLHIHIHANSGFGYDVCAPRNVSHSDGIETFFSILPSAIHAAGRLMTSRESNRNEFL